MDFLTIAGRPRELNPPPDPGDRTTVVPSLSRISDQ
jgi:hypothetical protein